MLTPTVSVHTTRAWPTTRIVPRRIGIQRPSTTIRAVTVTMIATTATAAGVAARVITKPPPGAAGFGGGRFGGAPRDGQLRGAAHPPGPLFVPLRNNSPGGAKPSK